MSAAGHVVELKGTFALRMVPGTDIISGRMGVRRPLKETVMERSRCVTTVKKRTLMLRDKIEDILEGDIRSSQNLQKVYSSSQSSSFSE